MLFLVLSSANSDSTLSVLTQPVQNGFTYLPNSSFPTNPPPPVQTYPLPTTTFVPQGRIQNFPIYMNESDDSDDDDGGSDSDSDQNAAITWERQQKALGQAAAAPLKTEMDVSVSSTPSQPTLVQSAVVSSPLPFAQPKDVKPSRKTRKEYSKV